MFPIRDHNPSTRLPVVTYALIAVNVIVFLSYVGLFDDPRAINAFFQDWGLVPAQVSSGRGWDGFVTSMFLHGGWAHLGGNMLFLWIFGDNLEDEMGHLHFLGFYLLSGLGAAIAQWAVAPFSPVPMVGASGAIAGVMGAYLLLFPRARVDILLFLVVIIRIFPVPAWAMLGLWFGLQLFNGVSSQATGGGVAYWAHAGGFVIGLVLALPLWIRLGGPRFWTRTDGHPPHPEARYAVGRTSIPTVQRRRR
ncbi:MAG: rhomboid family intramembrane serine protease [Shimia sp.]